MTSNKNVKKSLSRHSKKSPTKLGTDCYFDKCKFKSFCLLKIVNEQDTSGFSDRKQ